MIDNYLCRLTSYALGCNLIEEADIDYCVNRLIDIFGLPCLEGAENIKNLDENADSLEEILTAVCDYAAEKGIIEENTVTRRDIFDTMVMNVFVPRPSEVIAKFKEKYAASPKLATYYYYKLSGDSNYIRRYRVARDEKWTYDSPYGRLDITINLSKPEKDPRDIAAARNAKQSGYPKCLLCKENVGYSGTLTHPARHNHRIIPLDICGNQWYLQYSPYVYYNEHCIVFNGEHVPMVINKGTFKKLLAFINYFPHYTVGSNADLPIVGGSILSHEHYQGGNYEFPLQRAEAEYTFAIDRFPEVEACMVKWQMSVIRLRCKDSDILAEACSYILDKWRIYTDESAFIYCKTDVQHNTITPIARKNGGLYEMDLVLRNNITTEEHPLGVFHPHANLHHIKKENIGLIEVMGLAILPARLKGELEILADAMLSGGDIAADGRIAKHADWAEQIMAARSISKDNIMQVLHEEVGKVFSAVLEDAGVFKCDKAGRAAFLRFINTL
ncbi:MAG: UDP-glucose--hexose-1-phosphate uridylyltransferase [Clostridia bacterium]|nr:UDP-glucose--hexose-1-phosphate uridylyltransferase [Clostridia bacterium]